MAIWAMSSSNRDFDASMFVRIIGQVLPEAPKGTPKELRAVMNAFRLMAVAKRRLKQSFFNDIKEFITIFGENTNFGEQVTEDDLVDFVMAIVYLRDRREYGGALRFAEIIAKHFEQSPEELKPEFVAIYFLMAQAYEAKQNKSEAKLHAGRVLDLLKTRDPGKQTGVLAVQQLELIKKESEEIIKRASFIVPTIRPEQGVGSSTQKVGRNDPCPCGSGKKYKRCCGRETR